MLRANKEISEAHPVISPARLKLPTFPAEGEVFNNSDLTLLLHFLFIATLLYYVKACSYYFLLQCVTVYWLTVIICRIVWNQIHILWFISLLTGQKLIDTDIRFWISLPEWYWSPVRRVLKTIKFKQSQ